MTGDSELMVARAHVRVVRDSVLTFARRIQVLLPNGFHTHEDLAAAGCGKKFDELGNFPRHEIRLHHEAELQPFRPQSHEPFQDVLPMRVSRKIVVREEEKRILLFAARASHTIYDRFHAPVARIMSLNVDDRTEAAGEGAT